MADLPSPNTPLTREQVENWLKLPLTERMRLSAPPPPKPVIGACTINGTDGRAQTFLTAGPSPEEQRRIAEDNKRAANRIASAWLGPIFGGPGAVVRAAGGNEDQIAAAHEFGANFIGGVRGARVGRGRGAVTVAKRRGDKHLKPDPNAQGDHTTFRRDQNGNVSHHATWEQNPQNPSGFQEVQRVDTQYANPHSHGGISTPHVHTPGGIRPALPSELPP